MAACGVGDLGADAAHGVALTRLSGPQQRKAVGARSDEVVVTRLVSDFAAWSLRSPGRRGRADESPSGTSHSSSLRCGERERPPPSTSSARPLWPSVVVTRPFSAAPSRAFAKHPRRAVGARSDEVEGGRGLPAARRGAKRIERVDRSGTPKRANRCTRPTKKRGCTTGGGCTRGTAPPVGGPATPVRRVERFAQPVSHFGRPSGHRGEYPRGRLVAKGPFGPGIRATAYRPLNTAFRFSLNARGPSFASSV